MLSGFHSATWRHSGVELPMPGPALGVQGHGGVLHSHTLSSETLASMYEQSTDRSRGVASEAGSLQQPSSMMKNASDPSLRSTGSSFADLEWAGYSRHGFHRQEEQDIFSAVGGMELGADAELDSLSADIASTSGHERHSEPSRTLFVRHINPSASDEELLAMFKVFGEVRHIYTISKHRGFVMVTYFDLRAAVQAQSALNGTPISSVPMEIHFCAPRGDPTVNQGTVTVFNLDPDTSNEHLVWLFSKFGDVMGIRESPDRSNQKFITFYDTRHALAALRAMNKAEHLGKLPANVTPQLAASMSQVTVPDGAQIAMEASQRGHFAGGHTGSGAWEPQQTAEVMLQAHLAAKGPSSARAIPQTGTNSPTPLTANSPAGSSMMQTRPVQAESQGSSSLAIKFQQQQHGGPAAQQGMTNSQSSLEQLASAAASGVRSSLHVSDSASSISSVTGQAANQLLAAAAAAGRSPLGGGGLVGPHGLHSQLQKAMPSLATLSEAQVLNDQAAYAAAAAAAAESMLSARGSGGGLDSGSGAGSAADVNATANMLMGLQLSAAGNGSSPEQQLWALQHMAGAAQGQAAGQAGMWAAAAGSLYGAAAAQAGMQTTAAAAAANLQALRLQQGLQELQARQQQQQQQLAMAANLASLQGQSMSAAELNAAAAQLLHIAGLGGALNAASPTPYLPTVAATGLGVGGLGMAGLGGSAGSLGNSLTNAAAAQQLLQQAMAMGNIGALNALGGMQTALGGQATTARLSGSYGSLAGALAGSQASAHHHGAGSSRDSAAGSRGGGRLSRRTTDPTAEMERKAQQEKLYALDPVKIRSGEDKRTTLMIKNIPNKYTQKMLLATIDEQFRGTYDFFYLPIDFKNKCNVGYAFINMINPFDIIALVERFNNRRWERFNSEKICSISYARIQGRAALVAHFQNSSLMHEDKRCRPILFTANGTETTDPEAFQNDPSLHPMTPTLGGPSGHQSGASQAAGGGSSSGGSGGSAGGALAGVSAGAGMSGPARIRAAAAAVAAAAANNSVGDTAGPHT